MSDLKQRILTLVQPDLAAIEQALIDNLKPNLELVGQVAGHILFAGGKRLRPLLMVLCARLCAYGGDYHTTFSIIFEYLHAATLLHDDLVDGASLRRGKPAAHRVWGNSTAVLVGDFLLARALSIAAATDRPRVIQVVSEITENMSQGEIDQLARLGQVQISEAEYLEVIRRKTAVLFQGACRVSAILAEAPQAREQALTQYGFHLGMAFQMVDDLIDYTSDTVELGKVAGADLREGKVTLPVIHALRQAGQEERTAMVELILRRDFSPQEFAQLVKRLEALGGIAYTRDRAAAHIRKAKQALEVFEASDSRAILLDIADYALERKT